MRKKKMTVERAMINDLAICTMPDFVKTIRSVDASTQSAMLITLRATYQQLEFALKDLRARIEKKNKYTKKEGQLHIDLAKQMVNIEEKSRILNAELGNEEFILTGVFDSSVKQ